MFEGALFKSANISIVGEDDAPRKDQGLRELIMVLPMSIKD